MSLQRVYLITELDRFEKDLRDSILKAGARGMHSAALRLSAYIQTVVIPEASPQPVDRGIYKAGWGANSVSKIPGGAAIYNRTIAAPFVEHGVKRATFGAVPALTEWVVRKGIASADQAKSVAFAIVKAAQRKGGFFKQGEGLGIFKTAMEEIPTFIKEEVEREINKEIHK